MFSFWATAGKKGELAADGSQDTNVGIADETNPSDACGPNSAAGVAGLVLEKADETTLKKKIHVLEQDADFHTIRNSKAFTDKTLFVQYWMENEKSYTYITAPARFGKSSLLNMAVAFCEANYTLENGSVKFLKSEDTAAYKLFHETKIFAREIFFKKHFQQYIVIYINFAPLSVVTNLLSFKEIFSSVIRKVIGPFLCLIDCNHLSENSKKWLKIWNDEYDLIRNFLKADGPIFSPQNLVKVIKEAYNREIILMIDEYDAVMLAHIRNLIDKSDSQSMMDYLGLYIRGFVKPDLENKEGRKVKFITRSFFTGTLNLGGMMSPLANNVEHKDFFHDENIAQYYGFSEEEVVKLLKNSNLGDHYNIVKEWYDGYTALGSKLRLFNIVSVLKYIEVQRPMSFLEKLSSKKTVLGEFLYLISDYRIGDSVSRGLSNEDLFIPILTNIQCSSILELREKLKLESGKDGDYQISPNEHQLFITFLLELGMFSLVEEKGGLRKLKPTNKENRELLISYMADSGYLNKEFKASRKNISDFENAIFSFQPNENSIQQLGYAIYDLFSRNPPQKEYTFMSALNTYCNQAIRFGLTKPKIADGEVWLEVLEEKKERRKELKLPITGKIDWLLVYEDTIVFVEGKHWETAEAGLKQIINGRYYDLLKTHWKYSKLHFKHQVFIGLRVEKSGKVSMCVLIDSIDLEKKKLYEFQRQKQEK